MYYHQRTAHADTPLHSAVSEIRGAKWMWLNDKCSLQCSIICRLRGAPGYITAAFGRYIHLTSVWVQALLVTYLQRVLIKRLYSQEKCWTTVEEVWPIQRVITLYVCYGFCYQSCCRNDCPHIPNRPTRCKWSTIVSLVRMLNLTAVTPYRNMLAVL